MLYNPVPLKIEFLQMKTFFPVENDPDSVGDFREVLAQRLFRPSEVVCLGPYDIS